MNCKEFQIQIDHYLDRDLPAAEAREVKNHLAVCPACRDEYGPLIEFLNSPAEILPPPALRSKILAAINTAPVRRPSPWRFRLAAAAAIALLVLGWLVRPMPSPPAPNNTPAVSENLPIQADPWLLAGMVQSFATTGTVNPAIPLVQARVMKEWSQRISTLDDQSYRSQYTLHLPEPSVTRVEFPILEFALFSSMQKL